MQSEKRFKLVTNSEGKPSAMLIYFFAKEVLKNVWLKFQRENVMEKSNRFLLAVFQTSHHFLQYASNFHPLLTLPFAIRDTGGV